MAAHIHNTNTLSSSVIDNRLPEFAFHVSKPQSSRIICGDIFRSLHLVFASKCMRSIRLHTWHVVDCLSYTIDIFQTGRHYLTFRITREKELLNRGFIPIQPGLNIKQMGLFLKKCDAAIEYEGNNYFPVFISKPAHIWNRQGHEIRLLRLKDRLIVHFMDGDKRFQTSIDHYKPSAVVIDYLVNKCLIEVSDFKRVSFFEIQHQWKWKNAENWTIKRNYEISLLSRYGDLYWHILNTRNGEQHFQVTFDINKPFAERINYLVNKCLIKVEDFKRVSFFEIQHQWQWQNTEDRTTKRTYEISLLRRDDKLFWHVLNTRSGYEGWKEFDQKKESEGFIAFVTKIVKIFQGKGNETRIHNFSCSSSTCYKPDTDVVNKYRTIDEVITQIRDFAIKSIKEHPLEISIEPAIIAKSQIDPRVATISKFSYAVSITMGPEGVDGNHARIIVEGIMTEDFEPEQEHGLRFGDYFLHASHLLNENDIRTRYSERPIFSKRTPIWICSAEKVKKMIRRIQQAKNGPIRFDLYGNPRRGYNCFTWAREMLSIYLNIIPEEVSFGEKSLATHLISLVARPGNSFARPNRAYERMPPPR